MKPWKCPVCDGRCYIIDPRCTGSNLPPQIQCPACVASGVVWEPEFSHPIKIHYNHTEHTNCTCPICCPEKYGTVKEK